MVNIGLKTAKNHSLIRPSNESIAMFAMVFVALKIGCVSYVSSIASGIWFIAELFVILCISVYMFANVKINLFDVCVCLFYGILFLSTYINNVDMSSFLKGIINFSTLYLVVRFGLSRNAKLLIRHMSRLLFVYLVINTASAIAVYPGALFHDNLNPIFFMGGDNSSIRLYIFSICLAVLNTHLENGEFKFPILPFLNLVIFAFLRDIGSGKTVAVVLFFLLIFIMTSLKIPKRAVLLVIVFNIALFLIMVIFDRLDIFSSFVVDFLGRDLTLTNRTIIWSVAIEQILKSPIIGYGMISGMDFQALLPNIIGINAHNTYLMIIFDGGIALFSVFLLMCFLTAKRFDAVEHPRWIYVMPCCLLALMVHAQVEGWDTVWLIIFLLFNFSYRSIEEASPSSKNRMRPHMALHQGYLRRFRKQSLSQLRKYRHKKNGSRNQNVIPSFQVTNENPPLQDIQNLTSNTIKSEE